MLSSRCSAGCRERSSTTVTTVRWERQGMPLTDTSAIGMLNFWQTRDGPDKRSGHKNECPASFTKGRTAKIRDIASFETPSNPPAGWPPLAPTFCPARVKGATARRSWLSPQPSPKCDAHLNRSGSDRTELRTSGFQPTHRCLSASSTRGRPPKRTGPRDL